MDETKLTADLPNMTVEITHRLAEDGNGELMTIHLVATPNLRAALPLLGGFAQLPLMMAPLNAWTQAAQAILAPWAALARANPFLALPSSAPDAPPKR